MEKITEDLTESDFIIRTKFKGNRETFLQECIIQYNLVILDWKDSGKVQKSDGKIVEFDVDKAMETKLIKQAPQFNGNKAVFVVGKGTYENFVNGCKIENYLRKRDKTGDAISLEEWFNNFVNTQDTNDSKRPCTKHIPNEAKYRIQA